MKIVVIGGSGNIGSKLVRRLGERGHDVIAASPKSGVDAVTGEGLDDVMPGTQVVVDVANSPSFDAAPALAFFENAGRNLLAAEARAGVQHHVALSVVGTDRLTASGYFRAKMAQEELIEAAAVPFTILRATQFFEFVGAIAESFAVDGGVRAPSASIQPMAAEDVAAALADVALAEPANRTLEVAGPEAFAIDGLIRRFLVERADPRKVITDDGAEYFGVKLKARSLMPGADARLAPTHFDDWLRAIAPRAHAHAG